MADQPETDASDDSLRQIPFGIGLCVMAVGLAGVLDDGGAVRHRWWIPLAAAAILASLVIVTNMALRLRGESG